MANNNFKEVCIVGDSVVDVIFSSDFKSSLSEGKETLSDGTISDRSVVTGLGGVSYLHQIFALLFETHFPEAGLISPKGVGAITAKQLYKVVAKPMMNTRLNARHVNTNYWTAALRQQDLASQRSKVFRVIERTGQLDHAQGKAISMMFPRRERFATGRPKILVLADYNRSLRHAPEWERDYES